MDTTTIGLASGVLIAVLYAILSAYFKRTFELNHTVLIFLATFSVPGGIALIIAGFIGKADNLPSSWREHVTVAGIVAIGLALHYVVEAFKDCWLHQRTSTTEEAKRNHQEDA